MSDLTRLPTLTVQSHRTPFSFFTPTHLSFAPRSHSHSQSPSSTSSSSSTKDTSQNVTWQSRKARKGRYLPKTTHVHSAAHAQGAGAGGEEKAQGGKREVAARLKHPGSRLKPGFTVDISFWVAVSFTFGSMVWVVNGFVVWFPILRPSLDTTAFTNTSSATAFIGGTVFLVGSYLMVVEALDRGRESQFGTALGELLHYHRNHPSGSSTSVNKEQSPERDDSIGHEVKVVLGASGWVWWGKPLWHDMGYLAAVVQLFAATIFWISTLTGLPGVIKGFSTGDGSKAIIDVFFWTPQVIGGSGFIVSSLILMVEVQKKWYIPALSDIGWHIGFWNLVGAIGFTLCGALGYSSSSGAVYESALSTWWGSWAFLIGSGIQCAETVWREPGK